MEGRYTNTREGKYTNIRDGSDLHKMMLVRIQIYQGVRDTNIMGGIQILGSEGYKY